MVVMALDHVRHAFHTDAFLYEPTDLSRTNTILFFTRWITHFCAPIFVFLAGISAYLYGINKTKRELAHYLFTTRSLAGICRTLYYRPGAVFQSFLSLFQFAGDLGHWHQYDGTFRTDFFKQAPDAAHCDSFDCRSQSDWMQYMYRGTVFRLFYGLYYTNPAFSLQGGSRYLLCIP